MQPLKIETYQDALRGLSDQRFLNSQKYQEQQGRANRKGAHPAIVQFERRLVKHMAKLGVPLFAHCVVRDQDEQARVFAEGFSQAKFGQSAHNFGMAVDIIHSRKAWELTEREWQLIGHAGLAIVAPALGVKVNWGGDDKAILGKDDKFRWDPAHWELVGWKGIREDYPW
ncbi:hypothetical protein [Tortoise microvirus 76]|nr:hypothetical protein [Tortoise microvirus 76]